MIVWLLLALTMQPTVRLAVRVVNEAAVPVKTVAAAQKAAEEILDKAGVRLEWVDETTPRAFRFRLHLLPGRFRGLPGGTNGYAVLLPAGDGYAGVSYPNVVDAAAELDTGVDTMLGAAMAHELGHLLLGPAHSREGIMVRRFGWREAARLARGELLFSEEQAARLRTAAGPAGR